jgi:hypothetical protein
MRGTYLYAITTGEPRFDLGPIGLPDGTVDVVPLPTGGLSALVSQYEGPAFGDLSRADLLGRLVIHQRVIERAMAYLPVLPVKFGAVLASPDEAGAILTHFHGRLASALGEMADAVEIDLSASWDLGAQFAYISREPRVAALAGTTASGPSENSVEMRLQVGKLVHEALQLRRDEYRRRVVGDLVTVARDAQLNPIPSDEVVLNVAFLVDRPRLAQFDATVDRLAATFSGQLDFRYVGPLPPYSFATVELTRPDPVAIEKARQMMGLDEQISEESLQTRYRQLAAQRHPDRNPTEADAQNDFSLLNAAYHSLREYIRLQRAEDIDVDDSPLYDLSRETAAKTVLLEIKRADTQQSPAAGVGNEPSDAF